MRKVVNFIFIITLSLFSAQVKSQGYYGIKLGPNISTIGNVPDAQPRISFHTGVFGFILLTDRLAIQPELLYSQKGYVIRDFPDLKYKYSYVMVNFLFKMDIAENTQAIIGPVLGGNLSAKFVDTINNTSEDVPLRFFDAGLSLGLSQTIHPLVFIEGKLNFSLSNIVPNVSPILQRYNNRVAQVSLGIRLKK
ncbi:MAG: PorT family protein [Cyclobacteriaceae bacterium]|nr:PorT family protein [Cyclobacteriaceae bacterium]